MIRSSNGGQNSTKTVRLAVPAPYSVIVRVGSLLFSDLTEERHFHEREKYDLFAGGRTDIVMQADCFDARDFLDERFQDRPRGFDELGPDLLEQVSSPLGRKRLHEVLLGSRQHALQSHDQQITDQVGANVLGPAAHVFLLKSRNPIANCRFNFSLGLHGDWSQRRLSGALGMTVRTIVARTTTAVLHQVMQISIEAVAKPMARGTIRALDESALCGLRLGQVMNFDLSDD